MLNTALNKADIIYLLTQQDRLDSSMREELSIDENTWASKMTLEHSIALNVEVHEFINAAHKAWKYWKRKDMNMDDVLIEAIDVIHFCMLKLNKSISETEFIAHHIAVETYSRHKYKSDDSVKHAIYGLSVDTHNVRERLITVLQILDYYGFTSQDIIRAYNKKNKVNFERLAEGY